MSYSKIVSGMSNFQVLWKRGTVLGSQVGPGAHGIYNGDHGQAPAAKSAPADLKVVDGQTPRESKS